MRTHGCIRIVSLLLAMAALPACAQSGDSQRISLLDLPGWRECGAKIVREADGWHVVQPAQDGTYGWIELRLKIDLDRYPELIADVAGAGPGRGWTIKVDPTAEGPPPEIFFIPDNEQNGLFAFPSGEYLEQYGQIDGIIRFFILGKGGSEVLLKRLELTGRAAAGTVEQVRIDEAAPRQQIDGAGGQGDYALWDIGTEWDHVTPEEIILLLQQLQGNGVTVARVGAYSRVFQAPRDDPKSRALAAFVQHVQMLHGLGIKVLFVAWFPPSECVDLGRGFTDQWLGICVRRYAEFAAYCSEHGAPLDYFELQNEPPANTGNWNPAFLGRCGRALADEFERRKLPVEVVGPDASDPAWVIPWLKALGDKTHIVAAKTGADKRGTREMTAHQLADQIAQIQKAVPGERRYWLTEYGCWAWGNPDLERQGKDGPCDGWRYGVAMAEMLHYYLKAGVSCPLVWELYDVRRVDEVWKKVTPQDPKRWGMFKYKTEDWEKRAHFHTLGHYYRALRPGARLYDSRASGGLLPTAVREQDGWNLVVFNRFGYAKGCSIVLPTGDWGGNLQWQVSGPDNPWQTFTVTPQAGAVTVGLPAHGIGTLVLRQPE